jgi:hypothetical protein
LTSPKTSLKHVFLVEVIYRKLGMSKLSSTSSFGNKIDHTILGKNFRIISKTLDMWHSIHVFYLERDKNQHILGRLP